MSDLGQDDLLREICDAAEFVGAETEYSRTLLQERCPAAAHKIHRIYNGLDLANLPVPAPAERAPGPTTILSVGRLVPFKGFEVLLEACADLDRRNFDFRCQIVGDGPLRAKLTKMVDDLKLHDRIELCGALSQDEVFSRLRSCDIFALASVVDAAGASDVFPTVILEAMACGRPVVSTKLAGIPESVLDGTTGILVDPGDWEGFANALDKLVRSAELRKRFGEAGRARMQGEFSVIKTVEPLHQLFAARLATTPAKQRKTRFDEVQQAAYLVDQFPDEGLPFLETELLALRREGVPFVPFVLRTPDQKELSSKNNELLTSFQYLPDAMVIEAEWQAGVPLLRELEALRADQKHRPSSDLFLDQARMALILRKLFRQHWIGHVHATSSRTLLCALMLKKLLGVTVSVAIEENPIFGKEFLAEVFDQCDGGRSCDRELIADRGNGFVFDQTVDKPSVNHIGPWLTRKAKVEWTGARRFWQEWAQRLVVWTREA